MKTQLLDKDIVLIQSIQSPDGMFLKRIMPQEWGRYESDPTETHYCTIVNDVICISGKAPYSKVTVSGLTEKQMAEHLTLKK